MANDGRGWRAIFFQNGFEHSRTSHFRLVPWIYILATCRRGLTVSKDGSVSEIPRPNYAGRPQD